MANGLDFRVDIPALPPFAARLHGADRILNEELTTAMGRIVAIGQNESRQLAAVDTGRFRDSILGRVTSALGRIVGIWGSAVEYAIVMEEGRRAGAPMPPQGALLGWMGRHGIDASLEFVIRRAVARNGIKARHVFGRALETVKPIAIRELSVGVGRALSRIGGGR